MASPPSTASQRTTAIPPLIQETFNQKGERGLNLHLHAGQQRAWLSEKRTVAIIAGVRAGKTSFGAIFLHREIMRCGAGDYLVAAPSYPLINNAAGPEIERLMSTLCRLGRMTRHPWQFTFSPQGEMALWGAIQDRRTRILFGHADDPDSLAAMTCKAAWLDEVGQKAFKLGSWEEIQSRLTINQGRCLLTTTPYTHGWLKQLVYDPWKEAGGKHPEIDVIQFKSTMNPAFPREEYYRAKESLPGWKFRMRHDGEFERPAGAIYDCFDSDINTCPPFALPEDWNRYIGLDFGGVNTAAVFLAQERTAEHRTPTGRYFLYREYHAGSRTAKAHAEQLKDAEPRITLAVGGSGSEDQWRNEFAAGGLPVREPPIKDVEVGINRVWGMLKRGQLVVFKNCTQTLDQLETYSRELDDSGNPTEKIQDKETYHLVDACRYICSHLAAVKPGQGKFKPHELGRF
jgi:hypothetical protein